MLVRLDPNSSTINVLSVPRDLKVQIPEAGGLVTAKINAAYSVGGPNLLIKMLKQQVFPGLQVNHIVDVNFGGFADAGQRDRLRLHRRRPPLLQQHRATPTTRASTSSPATRSCAATSTRCRSCASATPTPTSSATPASRTSCAGPRTSTAPAELIANRDKLLKIFGAHTADRPRPAHGRRADQPVQPRRVLGRPHDQADPVPGDPPPVRRQRAGRAHWPGCPRLRRRSPRAT